MELDNVVIAIESSIKPNIILENSYQNLQNMLAHELLDQIINSNMDVFERLIIDLLVSMGYGGTRNELRKNLCRLGDVRIAGMIKKDKLGLDVINIQANKGHNSIGRSEIQAFVDIITGEDDPAYQQGVFISTSCFSKKAIAYAHQIEQNIALIDGKTLTKLMIEHNVGVSEHSQYVVKRTDSGYFKE